MQEHAQLGKSVLKEYCVKENVMCIIRESNIKLCRRFEEEKKVIEIWE